MKVKPNFTVFNQQSMLIDFLKKTFLEARQTIKPRRIMRSLEQSAIKYIK